MGLVPNDLLQGLVPLCVPTFTAGLVPFMGQVTEYDKMGHL